MSDKANTTPTSLVGHGPSRAEILDLGTNKIVIKHFPETERERVVLETHKMQTLREMSQQTQLFEVPRILEIRPTAYVMEYIPDCVELNAAIHRFPPEEVADKLVQIVSFLKQQPCYNIGSVWANMLEKFRAVKTTYDRYNRVVKLLPEDLNLIGGYSHGDLSFDNILVDADGDWYLIDPAWSKAESEYWDIGKIMQSSAFNWDYIKKYGVRGPRDPQLVKINEELLARFHHVLPQWMLMGAACQLARVARWCFADVLLPIVAELLETYLHEPTNDRCLNALRGTV